MKTLITLLLMLSTAIPLSAQKGLNIAEIFDGRYHDNKHAVVTEITSTKMLRDYNLSKYLGVTVTDEAEAAEVIGKAVKADGKKAIDREVVYKNGQPFYCFYVMPRVNGKNCYIFFLNQYVADGNKVMLLYLEGKADKDTVKKIFK